MKITLLDVENYKRLKKVVIVPGERNMILIAGMNKQGKSSLLDAMSACLGGKGEEPVKPIREGETSANIKIELLDEVEKLEYQVHKRFLSSGNSSLKVTGRDGKLASPQKILDRIIGNRFLDPLKFSRLSDKEQKVALLQVVDIGIDLEAWAKERKLLFDDRTDTNRDLKRHQVELDNNPDPGNLPEEIDMQLADRVNELLERRGLQVQAQTRLDDLRKDAENKKANIARIHMQLEEEERALKLIFEEGKGLKETFEEMGDVTEELEKQQDELKQQAAKQQVRLKLVAQQERHVIAADLVSRAEEKTKQLTAHIKALDDKKAAKLADAKMPVDGLSIGDDGLIYNNIPLSQASGAEQLAVSLALSAAMSPELRDIWVEDGALLDQTSLEQMSQFAEKNDLRIWLERVGESDEGALILEEGAIKV